MEKKQLTEKQLITRTHFLWLPLVVASLLTVLFALAGGGKGHPAMVTATGFLKRLPIAFVAPVTHLDKMGYYDLARRDSIALRQRLSIQSNYARQLGLDPNAPSPTSPKTNAQSTLSPSNKITTAADSSLTRIRQKLDALKQAIKPESNAATPGLSSGSIIATQSTTTSPARPKASILPSAGASPRNPDLSRFEQAIHQLQPEEGSNTELHELSSVVEKLLTLQRGQADTPRKTIPSHQQPPATKNAPPIIALPDETDTIGRFDSSRIEAVVPEETILVNGGQLRLQLTSDIQVGRQRVPAGTPVFGIASLNGERLHVTIDAIATEGHILPVNLRVEDEDGIMGIYIPGAPISEALRESSGQEISALGPTTLSTTLAGQAANAGMVLARSLIGKKIRPVKVTIPAGYHLLLHQKNPGL